LLSIHNPTPMQENLPDYFVPFLPWSIVDETTVPHSTQHRMHRAAFLLIGGAPGPVAPHGRLLASDVPLFKEEFPREGVRIERTYRLARWTDGSTHLWGARGKRTGAAVGSSGRLIAPRSTEQY
jgi:hypothetical protein